MSEFGHIYSITNYLIRQARTLKSDPGLLADPPSKRGRPLSDEVIQAVRNFCEDEEFSRICPGQKDFKSIKADDCTRQHKTKRLLLASLKELHIELKKRHPKFKIGLSSFL